MREGEEGRERGKKGRERWNKMRGKDRWEDEERKYEGQVLRNLRLRGKFQNRNSIAS